ncbi:class I SAM-dependent methyltransferase [Paenibacillus planticolens]|uniref:Methyltransferase domain-containing protein n=1 Tax=Paenibacillus planticolens TaxID=2654976 RepID=A0ABX1ZL62_9BACL|nr:class I SAM-dependent methyltransferase [Paenibacillus planticolens]NOV00827.1 methyltransferase domain-containing protein [Paenibacillus planticolens]
MENKRIYEQAGVAMTSRSYAEYEKMFMLMTEDLQGKRVLDVAGGASSFTTEARKLGIFSEAADPLYEKSPEAIEQHGRQEIELVAAKMEKLQDVYDWTFYGSLSNHTAGRVKSLDRFLEDFSSDDGASRYHAASLPSLPFEQESFDLVLCSHFLFLYEEQFDYAFHLEAVRELIRVVKSGGEVRIYPLLSFRTAEYSRLSEIMDELANEGHLVEKREASLPFLPNSHQYLSIIKIGSAKEENVGTSTNFSLSAAFYSLIYPKCDGIISLFVIDGDIFRRLFT